MPKYIYTKKQFNGIAIIKRDTMKGKKYRTVRFWLKSSTSNRHKHVYRVLDESEFENVALLLSDWLETLGYNNCYIQHGWEEIDEIPKRYVAEKVRHLTSEADFVNTKLEKWKSLL